MCFSEKLHELTDQLRELQKQNQSIKQEAAEMESRLKYELDQKVRAKTISV